jgi:hypothetical protein
VPDPVIVSEYDLVDQAAQDLDGLVADRRISQGDFEAGDLLADGPSIQWTPLLSL